MMDRRVVVTGIGPVTSIGIGRDAFWTNLVRGRSGIGPVTAFDTSDHFTHNGGEIRNFSPEEFIRAESIRHMNRSAQMGLSAAYLALEDAGIEPEAMAEYRAGISTGTTLGDAQTVEDINLLLMEKKEIDPVHYHRIFTHSTPAFIAAEFGVNGPCMMFSTACAAGNYAIAYGYDLIRMNRADIVIAGASDPMSRIEYTGFNQFSAVAPEKCRPFDRNRKGMMLAEGAAMLILETLEMALDRGASIYAEIAGYGLSCDARHMTNPSVEGVAMCMRKAMKEAGITPGDVDYICAHGTGTQANDRTECAAIREVFGSRHKEIPVSSIKSMLGHTMGAASAIEAAACALAVKHDLIPPTINFETPDPECDIDCVPNEAREHSVNIALNNSYAFGGNNASLVLKKYQEEGGNRN